MGECTIGTDFNYLTVIFLVLRFSRAIYSCVKRAITKKAVKVLKSLMARKILAVPVFKKSI
jgi:hypothetical protein